LHGTTCFITIQDGVDEELGMNTATHYVSRRLDANSGVVKQNDVVVDVQLAYDQGFIEG